MKALKMLVLIVAITFSSAVSASTNPTEKASTNAISETVSKLLKNPNFELNQDTNALVHVVVNHDRELVVLSVETANKDVEGFIKNRLNYKKVSKEVIGSTQTFKIPVKMLKSN